jgi:hypothetical protein
VRWRRRQQVVLADATPAALGELTQREDRRIVRAWMVIAVSEGRLFHAVVAVPQDDAEAWEDQALSTLASLRIE